MSYLGNIKNLFEPHNIPRARSSRHAPEQQNRIVSNEAISSPYAQRNR